MPTFPARRAKARQAFGYTTAAGDQRELRADAKGIVRPQTEEDQRILDTFELPVAKAASKKPARSRPAARSSRRSTTPAAAPPSETKADAEDAGADGGRE